MADPQNPVPDFFPAQQETPDFIPLTPQTLAAHAGAAPPPENVIRPASGGPMNYLENLQSDIQSGTAITGLGQLLRKMGATGTRSGVSGDTGAIVGGPAEAIPRIAHGFLATQAARVGQPSQFIPGMNEMAQGAGQLITPIAGATNPAFLPMAAGFGVAQQSGQGLASAAGAGPDTAQFIGNLTGTAALGATQIPGLLGARGTPAERLSAAMSKTLPKNQWANVTERLAAVNDKLPEVVGGSKSMADVAGRFRQRSLDLGQQFSQAIEPVKGNDITPQIQQLKAGLETAATNADPFKANAYTGMAKQVGGLKTLGQLDDFVAGINKSSGFNRGPESMVRQALTEAVRGITGQDFSPLRMEQSHWYTLARAASKSAIPEKMEAIQSAVTSPARKLAQFSVDVPKTGMEAVIKGSKLLQPNPQSLIKSIEAPPMTQKGSGMSPENINAIRQGGEATRRSSAEFVQDIIRRQGLPTDPMLADVQTQLNQRAAAFTQQREALGPVGLQSQQTFNPSPNPGEIPLATPYYERYGQPAAAANTPEATSQHMTAFQQAKSELGPNADIRAILQRAAKIQNPK